jgi:hypothetical protein
VSNVVSTVGGGSHVAHYPKKFVFCIEAQQNQLYNSNIQLLNSNMLPR